MKIDDNPFERWGLDPRDKKSKLTRAMREVARSLDAEEKEKLQQDWRSLMADPVQRAISTALTPTPISRHRDPWSLARELVAEQEAPELPPLQLTLEDVLVLPLLQDDQLYAAPPFLPNLLRDKRRRQRQPTGGDE